MERDAVLRDRRVYRSAIGRDEKLSDPEASSIVSALAATRARMGAHYTSRQVLGRRDAIGCVALEITQRCNLDCTLCYLSDSSEDVKDLPLEELFRRLDEIKETFGPGTVVQVTGGDPTLRKRDELVAIVRRARQIGLQPALFTNGIKATRSLLVELVDAGLVDVAFHVDMTQERKGYSSEAELNAVRLEYIERARGLPLTVIFNTTVFDGNFHEVPDLVRFFRAQTHTVRFASFQLQADTGRGELTKRGQVISTETVREQIQRGAEADLNWDPLMLGHPGCHSFAYCFSVGGTLYNMIDHDEPHLEEGLEVFRHVSFDRRKGALGNLVPLLRIASANPRWLGRFAGYVAPKLWRARRDLLAARGRIERLSFFIHNFMDADNLDCERVEACSFMVMSPDGPISMCAHNARRDDFILRPITIETENGPIQWNPLRERLPKKRKARGQREWKGNKALKLIDDAAKPVGGCGGCSSRSE